VQIIPSSRTLVPRWVWLPIWVWLLMWEGVVITCCICNARRRSSPSLQVNTLLLLPHRSGCQVGVATEHSSCSNTDVSHQMICCVLSMHCNPKSKIFLDQGPSKCYRIARVVSHILRRRTYYGGGVMVWPITILTLLVNSSSWVSRLWHLLGETLMRLWFTL